MAYQVVGSEVQNMFGSIAGRYDLINTVLSGGIHHLWRRTLLGLVPANSKLQVLDVCTGTADLIPLLESRYGQVYGADFCYPMLAEGVKKLQAVGKFQDGKLIQADALRLPYSDQSFDLITVAFGVRNLENLSAGLIELRRVLRSGGSLLVLEFGQPRGLIFPALYKFHSKYVMPTLGGLISGNRHAYEYLPETASRFPCGPHLMEILSGLGLKAVKYKALTGGIAYAYRADRVG